MRLYKKKMKDYKELIQGKYVRETSVLNAAGQSKALIERQGADHIRASYFEFLYQQSRFIKKRWWGLQAGILILLWLMLRDSDSIGYIGRLSGTLSTVFVILVIPEIWKNRKYSAVEIEKASFYSLRQICAARTLLFAAVDLMMVMVFFAVTYHTVQISLYQMLINFLVPFNVSSCICFRFLYSRWMDSEYTAVLACMVWSAVWSVLVIYDPVYQRIAAPAWIGILFLSFVYLIYCIRKSWSGCEEIWEELYGIKV